MAPPDIKKLLSIKIKPRKDPYTDQFSRIFMVKMMMLTATVTGLSWAKDKVCFFKLFLTVSETLSILNTEGWV